MCNILTVGPVLNKLKKKLYFFTVSSPVPDDWDTIVTPQYMSMFENVFHEPIEQHEESFSTQHIKHQITNDVNLLTTAELNSPINTYPSSLAAGIQKPSPLTFNPQSIEPLFSCGAENYESDNNECTPIPSPGCDFSDRSDCADETLVPITTPEFIDVTLTSENVQRNEEDKSPETPLSTFGNETVHLIVSDVNPSSVSSTTTSNDSATFKIGMSTPKNKRASRTRIDKGCKRNIHSENWVATKRKRLCNMGHEYISKKGTIKEARKMKASCNCRIRCNETFNEEMRLQLFSNFWGIGSHIKQWEFISKYVFQKKKKTCTNFENETVRRLHTMHYHLPINSNDNETVLKKVCKTMFLNTFSISKEFVYTALQKYHECPHFDDFIDGRGRHKNHNRVITEEMKQSVIDHVDSYAPVDSHYVRKKSSIKYLDPSLSFSKMFKMYTEWCKEKGYKSRVQSLRQYKDIVNANLKISFHVP